MKCTVIIEQEEGDLVDENGCPVVGSPEIVNRARHLILMRGNVTTVVKGGRRATEIKKVIDRLNAWATRKEHNDGR